MTHANITAIDYYLPPKLLTNEQLAERFPETNASKLLKISGIKQRHIADDLVTPSDLAFKAANKLLNRMPSDTRRQIDALLFCTEIFDYKTPATACLLHQRLGLNTTCLSLDIPGGCTGFINSLLVAQSLISSQAFHNVLLLTAETPSKVIHDDDLYLKMLFGDGACATLVTANATKAIGTFITGTDGSGANALLAERSGARHPIDALWLKKNQHNRNGLQHGRLVMQGDELLHFALTRVPNLINDTLVANQLQPDDIDLYVFHQASKIILRSLKRKCRLPEHKLYVCLENYGNTVSSSIPLALQQAIKDKVAQSGDTIMLAGFGVGLSWGATVITL